MKETAPTKSEWKDLYEAALAFKEIEPWAWMYDSDLFGVQDPVTGEIGYCCVMGSLGEFFALAVYLGTEGLESYARAASGPPEGKDQATEEILGQKCLMVSFGSRQELTDKDRAIIKHLGLKFRGKTGWPLFRSYRPGYFPWYLTADEARFLTLVLRQAREVCLRFKEDPTLFDPPKEDLWFVRVPEETAQGLVWKDAWLEPASREVEEVSEVAVDEVRLARIKKTIPIRRAAWEVDIFPAPTPAQDERGERPYFPNMLMVVDHGSGLILGTDLFHPEEPMVHFVERLLALGERYNWLPAQIGVKRLKLFYLLEPVISRLGIELLLLDRLEALDEARAAMGRFFGAL